MPPQADAADSPSPSAPPESTVEQQLAPLRERIDGLDRQIVELLNERARIVVDIGRVKQTGDAAIYAPDREQRVLAQLRKYNQGPLPDACLEAVWRELMSGSFALERPLRIGYLGPPGSFSHLAARKKFGASVTYDELADMPAVFDEVARGHIDYGLIPIENSTHGGVSEAMDCFLDTPARVCAEILLGVHHNLLSRHAPDAIEVVYSHQQALSQCKRWLQAQLPHARIEPVVSTSRAAELAASPAHADAERRSGSGASGICAAAIASALAAQLYDLPILYDSIEDNPNNTTRFFVIGKHPSKRTGDDKTSLVFTTEHKPGALTDVLNVFRDRGLNLTRLAERPSGRVNWEYIFFVDLVGHLDDEPLADAIDEAKQHCLHLTVLGSFPQGAGSAVMHAAKPRPSVASPRERDRRSRLCSRG